MRKILLMRHASAREAHSDHERRLSTKGETESRRVGARIEELGHRPELVVASSAARAVSTAEGVLSGLDSPLPLQIEDDLYLASPSQILECISGLDDACESVLLVVHNPGAAEFASWLQGSVTPEVEERSRSGFEPGTVAVFSVDRLRWTELVQSDGTLVDFVTPR